ncbi:MAG: DoxX family protein [Colwellia sp.]|nr:DoxX family protein [Colwellia sp.]MCW8864141.1 DoxX family protein [Colwellia sp.]MCW9083168.1 DoxX family protein [Colwellia sp.]
MRYVFNLVLIIVVLLSAMAGVAKVMHTPQEVEFLQSFGLNNTHISIFGAVQILGAALLSYKKMRLYGAVLVVVGFFISAVLIFVSGNTGFALISLLPVVLTTVIIQKTVKLKK